MADLPRMLTCSVHPLPYRANPAEYFAAIEHAPGAVLLDSGRPAAERGRYDLLSAWPLAELTVAADESGGDFLQRLRHNLQQLEGFTGLLQMVCSEAESVQTLPQVQEQYTRIIATKLLTLPVAIVVSPSPSVIPPGNSSSTTLAMTGLMSSTYTVKVASDGSPSLSTMT